MGLSFACIPDALSNAKVFESITETTWIGYSDTVDEGTFLCVEWGDAEYFKWNAGEPNDSGSNEDCAEMNSYGLWNDATCASNKPCVCTFPGTNSLLTDRKVQRFLFVFESCTTHDIRIICF